MLQRIPDEISWGKNQFHDALKIKRHVLAGKSDFCNKISDILAGKYTIQIWGTVIELFEEERRIVGENGLELKYLSVQEYRLLATLFSLEGEAISIKELFQTLRGSEMLNNASDEFLLKHAITPILNDLNKKLFQNLPLKFYELDDGKIRINQTVRISRPQKKIVKKVPQKSKTGKKTILNIDGLGEGISKWLINELLANPNGITQKSLISTIVDGREAEIDSGEVETVLLSEDFEDILEGRGFKIISKPGELLMLKSLNS